MTLAKNPGVHVSSTRNPYVVSCTVGMWNTFDQRAPAKTYRSLQAVEADIRQYQTEQTQLNNDLLGVRRKLDELRRKLDELYLERKSFCVTNVGEWLPEEDDFKLPPPPRRP